MPGDISTGSLRPASTESVAWRTLFERRRRVWRSVLLVLILSLAMIVLSIVNRDQQEVDGCRQRMEYAVAEFQRQYDEKGLSPTAVPLPEGTGELADRLRAHIHYNWFYTESPHEEVGVCCCRHPHTRLFLPAGRHVITFSVRQRKYKLTWMNEDEFVRRAEALGLRLLLER